MSGTTGKVYFIGAGPGDPELLTRKAWRLLSRAEVVLHDALVAPEILRLVPPRAILHSVGKRCGPKSITQEEIHARLIEHARAGRTVIRLQGGDPLIFGRAGEEIAALQAAGIDFEIVPGVTAASAAAAAAHISLTRRLVASQLIFLSAHGGLSAHRGAGPDAAPYAAWNSLPSSGATLAIYMPGRDYESIARRLATAGWAADTPCVIVSQAGAAGELIVRVELASLAAAPEVPAPAILLVGVVTGVVTGEVAAPPESSSFDDRFDDHEPAENRGASAPEVNPHRLAKGSLAFRSRVSEACSADDGNGSSERRKKAALKAT